VHPTGMICGVWRDACLTCCTQLGTADGVNALKAAEVVARDVAGIDVNMGCPKQFSAQGGMGALLLKRPEAAADIIATLKRNLNTHVSCKVRALEDPVEFSEFLRRMEAAGADAITVHCRYRDDRPIVPARWNLISTALDTVHVPTILNGDVYSRAAACDVFKDYGVRGCMIARGAMENPSCFREHPLPARHAQQQWVAASHYYNEPYQPLKFVLMKYVMTPKTPEFLAVQESKSSLDICRGWGLQEWAQGGAHWLQAAGAGAAGEESAPLRHASQAFRRGGGAAASHSTDGVASGARLETDQEL
jgi:tRNA-dihydrouridine synthase 2